jgi:hypothetical protein
LWPLFPSSLFEQHRVLIIVIAMAGMAVAQQYGAMPELGPGMSPRYFLGIAPIVKRQSGSCGANKHHCMLLSMITLIELTRIAQARISIFQMFAVAMTNIAMSTLKARHRAVLSILPAIFLAQYRNICAMPR